MEAIDVRDLPEPVARAIRDMVEALRKQLQRPATPGEVRELPVWQGTVIGRLTRKEIYDYAN
jgi:hypothetical protein